MAWLRINDDMVDLDGVFRIRKTPSSLLLYYRDDKTVTISIEEEALHATFEALFRHFIPVNAYPQEQVDESGGRSGDSEELVPGVPGHSDAEAPVLEADPLGVHDAPGVQS
jgi:hypothetical protein